MKTQILASIAAILLFSFAAPAPQKDTKATGILNKLSEKTKAYTSITADFTYAVKSETVNEEQKGKLQLKGDKYKYNLFGVTKISDGKKICTILDDDEEVIITKADYSDPDEFSPKEIFTIYKKGYKYRYIKEATLNNVKYHVIELYPEANTNNPYRRITMYISVVKTEIYKVEFFHKTSTKVFSLRVDKAQYNLPIVDTVFTCNCGIKPSYDCDDQSKAQ